MCIQPESSAAAYEPTDGSMSCTTCDHIDMMSPAVAGERLQLNAEALLDVVNRGLLPAYDLGGVIRFRRTDVVAVERLVVSAHA